ncbi:hypothetical protein Tco_1086120, partial [Tanacetum coccineum]
KFVEPCSGFASALANERRGLWDRNHACFHPEDLNRLWEGPIPENGGWHLAQEVKMAANKR